MRAAYPDLRVVADGHIGTIWQGPLSGFDRIYLMQFALWDGRLVQGWELENGGIETLVLWPDLAAESGGLSVLPHVYRSTRHPRLCLYDPESGDWGRERAIADTIVPWAAQWLAFYELWQVTGRWTGPERHPSPDVSWQGGMHGASEAVVAPSPRQIRDVTQWLGTEGSRPILGTLAEGRMPPLRRDWGRYQGFGALPARSGGGVT